MTIIDTKQHIAQEMQALRDGKAIVADFPLRKGF